MEHSSAETVGWMTGQLKTSDAVIALPDAVAAAAALRAANDTEKVSINALRALGNLLVAAFTGCTTDGEVLEAVV